MSNSPDTSRVAHKRSSAIARGLALGVGLALIDMATMLSGSVTAIDPIEAHANLGPVGLCSSLRVVDRPLAFTERRKALTLEYMRAHYEPDASSMEIVPRMIVIHRTDRSTADAAASVLAGEALPSVQRKERRAGELNTSVHFLIDRQGTVFRLMPVTWMARHVIGLNHAAIGIENVGERGWELTAAQISANVCLIARLGAQFPSIRYLIGHHESARFRGTPLWKERMPGYASSRSDPGSELMTELRSRVKNPQLSGTFAPEASGTSESP